MTTDKQEVTFEVASPDAAVLGDGSHQEDEQQATSADSARFDQLKNAMIMMVDDESINTEVVQAFLEEAGYRNFVITDQSTEALGLLETHRPDILLLDLMMPEVSGFDILTAMRSHESLQYMPVIVLTSSSDAETKLKALELGATDFLAKPVDSSELALRMRNTLAAKAYQDQLAYYDALTGLPNRRMFLGRLDQELANARRDDRSIAVLNIGLDRFKQINDTLGLQVGDALLKAVGQQLAKLVRVSDPGERRGQDSSWMALARLGGDEFAITVPETLKVANADILARRVVNSMSEPFQADGHEVFVTPSIGIAVFPEDGEERDTLLKHASIATYHAKQQGRNTYQFYSSEINARSTERLKLENELRRALDNNELLLYYQPRVATKTGRMTGIEALLRWQHARLGLVMPEVFVSLAEEAGLIGSIGEWVLHEACRPTKAWHEAGLDTLEVSVNVSGYQFRQPSLEDIVRDALKKSGLESPYLTLELTESTLMADVDRNMRSLSEMKELGVKLSIDDFGTGYSSLSYLKRFPLDELKIDRSFIADVEAGADDAAIVTAIIAMGQSLGLTIVAEGVENQGQLAFLRDRNCDLCQGFLFSAPMSEEALTTMIEQRRRKTADG